MSWVKKRKTYFIELADSLELCGITNPGADTIDIQKDFARLADDQANRATFSRRGCKAHP